MAKTHEQFTKEFTEKHPDYIPVSFYVHCNIKIKIRSLKCGHEWEVLPSNALREDWSGRCPICNPIDNVFLLKTPPIEKVIEEIEKKYPNRFEYIGGYTKMSKKCWWKCKICGFIFKTTPSMLKLRGSCSGCKKIKMHEMFAVPLQKFLIMLEEAHNGLIEYIEGYYNMETKCKFKCKICGNEWLATPKNVVYNKTGCPNCIMDSMEKPVIDFFIKNKIDYEHNKPLKGSNFNGSRMPLFLDFVISTNEGNLVIETDGRQHFIPMHGEENLKIIQARDRHKDKILKEQGYILIRVTSSPTKEWGFKNHITLKELLHLIEIGVDENGNVNLDVFRPYDFNRE